MSGGCAISCCERPKLDTAPVCDRHWGMAPAELRGEVRAASVRHAQARWRIGPFAGAGRVDELVTRLELKGAVRRLCSWWNAEPAR